MWVVIGLIGILPSSLVSQQSPRPAYQWTNAGSRGPGWLSQYPLSAQTTRMPSFSSTFPLGINPATGVVSNGEDLLVAEGRLINIDTVGRRLWVMTDQEDEMVFYYTDVTQTLGTGVSVEGLSQRGGSVVRILFTRQGGKDNAVHIELRPGIPSRTPPRSAFP
ncbi:MAG: hypothetical protein HY648_03885 [Acidobacteria bacterium]|nr:hypothetical protein [Acidobacteriota bacterium]